MSNSKIILELTETEVDQLLENMRPGMGSQTVAIFNKIVRQYQSKNSADKLIIDRKLLEKLVLQEPLIEYFGRCIYCNAEYDGTRNPESHTQECPWVAARKLLGDDFS
jgi:hypothetical protein